MAKVVLLSRTAIYLSMPRAVYVLQMRIEGQTSTKLFHAVILRTTAQFIKKNTVC